MKVKELIVWLECALPEDEVKVWGNTDDNGHGSITVGTTGIDL